MVFSRAASPHFVFEYLCFGMNLNIEGFISKFYNSRAGGIRIAHNNPSYLYNNFLITLKSSSAHRASAFSPIMPRIPDTETITHVRLLSASDSAAPDLVYRFPYPAVASAQENHFTFMPCGSDSGFLSYQQSL